MQAELIDKLTADRDALFDVIGDLTEQQIITVPVIGEWTVKDAVGHIAYWEGVILDHVRQSFTEGRPRPQQPDETDKTVNPREAARRKDWSWSRVRAEYENVRGALIDKVNRMSDAEFTFQVPNPWLGENRFYSVGQMIEEDAIGHSREHTEQIRRMKESPVLRERRWLNART